MSHTKRGCLFRVNGTLEQCCVVGAVSLVFFFSASGILGVVLLVCYLTDALLELHICSACMMEVVSDPDV